MMIKSNILKGLDKRQLRLIGKSHKRKKKKRKGKGNILISIISLITLSNSFGVHSDKQKILR